MSGRWLPPACGWLLTTTCPSFQVSPRCCICHRTAHCIAPKWTGRCGAFATRPPSGPNKAQLKSSLSLMLVEMEVRWRVLPICSAMLMKRCSKTERRMLSHSVPPLRAGPPPTSSSRSPEELTRTEHWGSTTTVEVWFRITAGPSSACPGRRLRMSYTAAACHPPAKYTLERCTTAGGALEGSTCGCAAAADSPTALTRTSSTRMGFPGERKPNSRS
mmetsp:Transcript_2355/g.8379  ORF Transcript_2355/g.8379 Transcript_2355/m.8379 type:complete len:217 (+) Transcript_2355:1406-2056(+)